MKQFSEKNLTAAFALTREDLKGVAEATQKTFDEIYENQEALDRAKVGATYDAATKTLTLESGETSG